MRQNSSCQRFQAENMSSTDQPVTSTSMTMCSSDSISASVSGRSSIEHAEKCLSQHSRAVEDRKSVRFE